MDSNIKQHQEMGYDRSAGMFSPDGLLLQIEYAEKAVKLGATSIGITTTEGVILITDRKIQSKLICLESFKKIQNVDDHIIVTGSGIMSDGRRLIEEAQKIAQEHKIKFQESIDVLPLVKDIANIKQYYSQAGGLRPFGVKLLFGAIENNEIKLYETTPSGIYMRYYAKANGKYSDEINKELETNYNKKITLKEGIKLGLKILKKILKEDFSIERLDIVSLDKNLVTKRYTNTELKKFN